MKRNFLDVEKENLTQWCLEKGFPRYRGQQLWEWQSRGINSFDDMTNLPLSIRNQLREEFIPGLPEVFQKIESQTGDSLKAGLTLWDGQQIEVVIMRHPYGQSLCLSTEVGCAMGCRFCASTGLGFPRRLTRGELLGQFFLAQKLLGQKVTHIDLMGIGEPFDNYEEVIGFIRRLQDPQGLCFSPRNITLSTCGLPEGMRRLAQENLPVTLSLSLHAPNQDIREQLMPIAKKVPYDELLSLAVDYFQQTGRRVSYEYALFKGVNDKPEHARELAGHLQGQNCHVNLIPANPVPGTGFLPSDKRAIQEFQSILEKRHIPVTLRRSLGKDIRAACGQLRRSALLDREPK